MPSSASIRSSVEQGHGAADRRIAAALFLLTAIAYGWFFGGGGWNQNAHFDLTRAIVERGTIRIDGYHTNTADVAVYEGNVYANKPPGLSLLGAIPYAVIHAVERAAGADPGSPILLTLNAWLTTLFAVALPAAAIPLLLYLYGRRHARSARFSLFVAAAIALATPLFPFATVLFLHATSAALLLLAFVLVRDGRAVPAGAAAGLAGFTNYLAIPVAAMLALFFVRQPQRGARAVRYLAAAAPFAVALMLYQWTAFGSPLRTSVAFTAPEFLTEGALLGIFRLPDPAALWGITFSPFRGLFFASPILLAAFAGLVAMFRRNERATALFVLATVAFFFLANASFNGWHAGNSFGPRYVIPAIPFLGIAMLHAKARFLWLWATAAAVSFANSLVATAVDPLPPLALRNPLADYLYPLLLRGGEIAPSLPPHVRVALFSGRVSVNRQTVDEIGPLAKFGPMSLEGDWASFNLGEALFGAGSPWSLLPIVVILAAGGVWLWMRAGEVDRVDEVDGVDEQEH